MTEERSKQTRRAEQSEDRTLSSGNVLTSDDPRFVSGQLDDEITQRQAAAELGWSQSKVSQVVNQIHE